MHFIKLFAFSTMLVASAALTPQMLPAIAADPAPVGSVTLAKSHGDAVAVWDASDAVAALVAKKASKEEALHSLESDATRILIAKAPSLKDKAATLTVNVIYKKTGAVSKEYQVATFEGLERLLYVKGSLADATATNTWIADITAGKPSKTLEISLTGALPEDIR